MLPRNEALWVVLVGSALRELGYGQCTAETCSVVNIPLCPQLSELGQKLTEYTPPAFQVDQAHIHLKLDPIKTIVNATFSLHPYVSGDSSGSQSGDSSGSQSGARGNLVLYSDPESVRIWSIELLGGLDLEGIDLNGLDLESELYEGWAVKKDLLPLACRDGAAIVIPSHHLPPTETIILRTVSEISPRENKQLSGLYEDSEGHLITQNEAEGFRRITPFPDRPDVQAKFTITLEANKEKYPVLLSNGNGFDVPADELGSSESHARRFVDPFRKPSYLVAIVAGKLNHIHERIAVGNNCADAVDALGLDSARKDTFIQQYCNEKGIEADSPREVDLYIWGNKPERLNWAMESLRRAMLWDEVVFGRVYDLEEYHIVCTPDFNAGAMENKGLNIFNDALILADDNLSSDQDRKRIEAVIAHEYFHNWSGNRVTLRDWFQLTLKEGFTVFRDQQFTTTLYHDPTGGAQRITGMQADSKVVATGLNSKRIHDAEIIRAVQFKEDSSPLSHPIRPGQYTSIENFYTVTVYEKGAEIVRMYLTLLGWDTFRAGTDKYFEDFDGTSATCEDFLASMQWAYQSRTRPNTLAEVYVGEDAAFPDRRRKGHVFGSPAELSKNDFQQFALWYSTPGTPTLRVEEARLVQGSGSFEFKISQESKNVLLIPLRVGLVGQKGDIVTERLFVLNETSQTFVFENVPEVEGPVSLSLPRAFSAPVSVVNELSTSSFASETARLAFLAKHDTDGYIRHEAAEKLLIAAILGFADSQKASTSKEVSAASLSDSNVNDALVLDLYDSLIEEVAKSKKGEREFYAMMIQLPSISVLQQKPSKVDPLDVYNKRERLARLIVDRRFGAFEALHQKLMDYYEEDPVGIRALQASIISLLSRNPNAFVFDRLEKLISCTKEYNRALALPIVANLPPSDKREALLAIYRERAGDEALLVDKWLRARSSSLATDTLDYVKGLVKDQAVYLNSTTPNRIRAVIHAFASNPVRSHSEDGYRLIAEEVRRISKFNGKVAATLAKSFASPPQLVDQLQTIRSQVVQDLTGAGELPPIVSEVLQHISGDP